MLGFFLVPLAIAMIVLSFNWHFSRSATILDQWAAQNGYQILEKSYRHFFRGPLFWRTSKNQAVYRVVVRDKAGKVGTGWVACGSYWLGLWSDQATVQWEEPPHSCHTALHDRWLDG